MHQHLHFIFSFSPKLDFGLTKRKWPVQQKDKINKHANKKTKFECKSKRCANKHANRRWKKKENAKMVPPRTWIE